MAVATAVVVVGVVEVVVAVVVGVVVGVATVDEALFGLVRSAVVVGGAGVTTRLTGPERAVYMLENKLPTRVL